MDDFDHRPLPSSMAKTTSILRKSIFIFLKDLHHFSSTPALLALPFAFSALLSPPLISSSAVFRLVHARLQTLFLASGFPPTSDLFAVLNLKLSQTLLSFFFLLPFTLSSLLAKAFVMRSLFIHFTSPPSFLSWATTLGALVTTHFCNALVVLSANATCFSLLVMLFNALDLSGLSYSKNALLLVSAGGAVVYSIAAAHAYVTCNMALIVSGVEGRGGFGSILRAVVLMRGRTPTALALAVSVNAALAGVEAIFQYRVVRGFGGAAEGVRWAAVVETILIGYIYAVVLVVDAIVGCVFLKGCGCRYETIGRQGEGGRLGVGKGKLLEMVL